MFVSEFYIEDGIKFVVGLKDLFGGGGGIVCIFDLFLFWVIKVIEIFYFVIVLECVISLGGV